MSKLNKQYVNECVGNVIKQSTDKKRRFVETVELQVVLKDYDPSKDKRFAGVIKLRHPPKRHLKACIFADAFHLDEAKKIGLVAMELDELKKLNKDKKLVKKLVQKYDVFLASDTVLKQMPKVLGSALHVFNKMGKFPQVVTHHDNIMTKIDEVKASIKFQLKKTLCLGTSIGHVEMTEEQITQNVYQSVNYLVSLLKKNWNNVRSLHIKSTMGKPQRLY